jgi:hypothetical protein
VCREFCFRYQALFHKTHCKSFYLHTLLAHAGDFMRELEKHDMCLGMMSNSGAERRHEYGRRAFRRSLCGGCWAKHDPELANKANMSAFLTLREILIWQYGSDLLGHEKARRAAASLEEAQRAASPRHDEPEAGADGLLSRQEGPRPLLRLTPENLEIHCCEAEMTECLNQLVAPLLSLTEEEDETQVNAPMEADTAQSFLGETTGEGWERVRHDQSLALNSVPVSQEEAEGLVGKCYSGPAGKVIYEVGRDSRLTNGICDVVSDVDGDGSEDASSDGSGSESSDCSSDGGRDIPFQDLEDFSEDDDAEEWDINAAKGADACEDGEQTMEVDDCGGSCANVLARRATRNPSWTARDSARDEAEFPLQFVTPGKGSAGAGSPSAEPKPSLSSGSNVGAECGQRSIGAGLGKSKLQRKRGDGAGGRRRRLTAEEREEGNRKRKTEALTLQFRV